MERLRQAMGEDRLDAMLLFCPESLYWLTGYDSFGFMFFQCLIVTKGGRMALLTRAPDLRQARHTSIVDEIIIWADRADADPAKALKEQLFEMDLLGARLGIETDTMGLTAMAGKMVDDELRSFGTLLEASALVPRLRAVKSAAEIAYVREAASLADAAMATGIDALAPGVSEGRVRAAIMGEMLSSGGDAPASEVIVGSGRDALLVRGRSASRTLEADDQVMMMFAASSSRYHAALIDVVVLGTARERHGAMFEAAAAALEATHEAMRPGNTFGDVSDAHARVIKEHGMGKLRLNSCGASLGAAFGPSWIDPPMFYQGNETEIVPNMVLFGAAILLDSEHETAMAVGRSYLTHDGEAEPLSRRPVAFLTR